MKTIYLAGGCFWGIEHYFKKLNGVIDTETGFANGATEAPTYEQVYTDTTGYAETVRITYDENILDFSLIMRMFFAAIDPTSLNQQGNDIGTRYRTGIYYTDDAEQSAIEKFISGEQRNYDAPIVVEVEKLKSFYPADESHQDYLDKNPDGYCHLPLSLFTLAQNANKSNGKSN